jgi:hypothetical protein
MASLPASSAVLQMAMMAVSSMRGLSPSLPQSTSACNASAADVLKARLCASAESRDLPSYVLTGSTVVAKRGGRVKQGTAHHKNCARKKAVGGRSKHHPRNPPYPGHPPHPWAAKIDFLPAVKSNIRTPRLHPAPSLWAAFRSALRSQSGFVWPEA